MLICSDLHTRYSLRLIRFLYMTRHPHSRHRIGSRALISFDAAQSGLGVPARVQKQR